MNRRILSCVAAACFLLGGDLLACGDKFLIAGRGTRYQRPKTARAASVLIYANPDTGLPAALKNMKVDSVLKGEGHRATTVQTYEQLSAVLAGGRFDVVLASSNAAPSIEKLLGGAPDSAVLVPVDSAPKNSSLLKAIDQAVARRDQNVKKSQTRS